MNNFKFRAWDKKLNKFRDDVVITNNGGVYIIRSSEELNTLLNSYYDNKGFHIGGDYGEIDYSDWYAIENIIIQYFTGRFDKFNNEIYEGDILKDYDFPVEFWYGSYGARICYDLTFVPLHDLEDGELKIIGNKFENPDLLYDF